MADPIFTPPHTRRATSEDPSLTSILSHSLNRFTPYQRNVRSATLRTPLSRRPLAQSESSAVHPFLTSRLATTPHGREAQRTLHTRRATLRTRRASSAVRESPLRGVLRALSTTLAKNSEVIASSSSPDDAMRRDSRRSIAADLVGNDDDDDDLPINRPRLSLPLSAYEDDDSDLRPHRSAGLEYEDHTLTMQSVEMPRRMRHERMSGRLSMDSVRFGDFLHRRALNLYDHIGSDDVNGADSGFFPRNMGLEEEDGVRIEADTQTLERIESPSGPRISDFGIEVPLPSDPGNENTFVIAPDIEGFPESSQVREDAGADDRDDYDGYDAGFEPLSDISSPEGEAEAIGHADLDDDDEGGGSRGVGMEDQDEENNEVNADMQTADFTRPQTSEQASAKRKKKANLHLSQRGVLVPMLPLAVVKRVARQFARSSGVPGRLPPDVMTALDQATGWFFEQLGYDLEKYAKHAGRKTVCESDVMTLMKIQRQIGPSTTAFSLAQRHLPRELLQELRMPPPARPEKRRRKEVEAASEDGG